MSLSRVREHITFFFFSHTGQQFFGEKVLSMHCCTLTVGLCICGDTPARSRTMPSPPCCLLDVSWCKGGNVQNAMGKTNQSTLAWIISFPISLLRLPVLSALHCRLSAGVWSIIFPLCLSQGLDAKQQWLDSQSLCFLMTSFHSS